MTDYVCRSQGHRVSHDEPPGPDERCPLDNSTLVRMDGSAEPTPLSDQAAVTTSRPDRSSAPGQDNELRPVVRLHVMFGDIAVRVERGRQVMLGRDPEYSPYGEEFDQHNNVSRRHAEIGLDADGRAWIRDCYSTNLTRVDATALRPGQGGDLRHGSRVRLCQGMTGTVELVREDSDGA